MFAVYLWGYLVPQWVDDILDQVATKWRNTLLFLIYGEDFTNPPPLEVDSFALPPRRSPEEEEIRFHPKFGFRPSSTLSSLPFFPPTPPGSPRKARRKEQEQRQRQSVARMKQQADEEGDAQQLSQEKEEEMANEKGEESVWDPTWGVISRELQATWREQEETRQQARRALKQKPQKPLPPVRS